MKAHHAKVIRIVTFVRQTIFPGQCSQVVQSQTHQQLVNTFVTLAGGFKRMSYLKQIKDIYDNTPGILLLTDVLVKIFWFDLC